MNRQDMPEGTTVQRWDMLPPPPAAASGETYDWRETWGPGEWESEPDLIEWRAAGSAFPRLALRNRFGNWCGYVGLPPEHPSHGKDYSDEKVEGLRVHGGVTYARACGGAICHSPLPGEPEHAWWVGFDTAHAWDYSPGLVATTKRICGARSHEHETYRTLAYVVAETEALARQLEVA